MAIEHLLTYQQESRDRTAQAVVLALSALKAEIESGILDPAEVTKRMISDRAGIGRSSLKNSSQRETREVVENWLAALEKTSQHSSQIPAREASLPDLARQLDRVFLELEKLTSEHSALTNAHNELQAKLARTERELAEARRTSHLKSI